jgi:large subunit ribosomal protein L4
MAVKLVKSEGDVFGADYNEPLIHQAVVAYQANARQGTRAQKNRSAVSGGGAKPFRQKGTGRARAGTSRGPIWRGGGRTFPNMANENFSQKMNRKAHRVAMRSIFSELARQERLIITDDIAVKEPKTKQLVDTLKKLNLEDVLVVTHEIDANLALASRNLYHIGLLEVSDVNPLSLVGFNKVVMTTEAAKQIEEKLK